MHTPLVVFLGDGEHGSGTVPMFDAVPDAYACAYLEPSIPYRRRRRWFATERRGTETFERGDFPERVSFRETLDAVRTRIDGPDVFYGRKRCYLVGADDGMTLAAGLLFDDPSRFTGAVLSGGILPFDSDVAVTEGRLCGKDLLVAERHSSEGSMNARERAGRFLREASGANVTSVERSRGIVARFDLRTPRDRQRVRTWFDAVARP